MDSIENELGAGKSIRFKASKRVSDIRFHPSSIHFFSPIRVRLSKTFFYSKSQQSKNNSLQKKKKK